jgi:hypothetical protein
MPVILNEPISLLQKMAEELEYCELLEKADCCPDPIRRLQLVAGLCRLGYER